MSRVISIVVLFAVIAPSSLIFGDLSRWNEANLPACCRRDGKHHCAMMAAVHVPTSGTMLKAKVPVCPFRLQTSTVPVAIPHLPAASAVHFAGLENHPAIHEQTQAWQRVSEARSHQKRGPPTSVLS